MTELTTHFGRFTDWRLPARLRGRLQGDPISRLSHDWELWLTILTNEEKATVISDFDSVSGDEPAQTAFLRWLNKEQFFAGNGPYLAGYQLVRCEGFARWSVLVAQASPAFLPDDCGVNCLFLLGGREREAGIIKTMVGNLGPEVESGEVSGKILPLNFSLSGRDEPAWQELERAMEAVRQFFGAAGIPFWLAYVMAGDFLAFTCYRVVRTLFAFSRIRRALRRRNIYLQINTRTGGDVAGPSLGLAACVAGIMSVSKFGDDRTAKFLKSFFLNLFAKLPLAAITGKVNRGRIESVDGIEQKLEALRSSPNIRYAIIPAGNCHQVRSNAASIINPVISSAKVDGCSWVCSALLALTPWRKTWLVINLFTLAGVFWLLTNSPAYLHRHLLRSIKLAEVKTSVSAYTASDLRKGIEIRVKDHVGVRVVGHEGDGSVSLKVGCVRGSQSGIQRQCLRGSFDEEGDWRSEVTVPVAGGIADFDFQQSSVASLPACEAVVLTIVHHDEISDRVRVPIQVIRP